MNTVNIIGRLVRDPEIKNVGQNILAKFTVAVNGFKKDDTSFINCVAWNKTAELVEKHFFKGQQVGITGRLQTGSYDHKDGYKVYTTDVIVSQVDILEWKDSGQGNFDNSSNFQSGNNSTIGKSPTVGFDEGFDFGADFKAEDERLPF